MTTPQRPIRTEPRRPNRRACTAVLPDRSSVRRCDPPATTRSGATDNCGARDLGRQRQGAERRGGAAGMTAAEPFPFREAVAAMSGASVRSEIELGPIRPPQRLAPYSYALGAEVKRPEVDIVPERSDGDAFGRLILLYDPEGADAWDGTMRLVAYIQADLDSSEAGDPLLPAVAGGGLGGARGRARARRRPPRSAARSPPPPRGATAISPDHRAPTSWSCARRGRRSPPTSVPTSRRSAKCSSTQRGCHRSG